MRLKDKSVVTHSTSRAPHSKDFPLILHWVDPPGAAGGGASNTQEITSWGEGVLLGRVGCGGQLTRLCGIREGACFLILVGPLMRDFEADSRL